MPLPNTPISGNVHKKESLPAEKLERISDSLDAKNLESLRFVFEKGPEKPIFAEESQHAEMDRLLAQRDELLQSAEYKALVEHLGQAVDHLENSDTAAADLRIKLLLSVLSEVGPGIQKHNSECAVLADKTAAKISSTLNLPPSGIETVTRSVRFGAPAPAPEGADANLVQEGNSLKMEWRQLLGATAENLDAEQPEKDAGAKDLRKRWEMYAERVSAYEKKCIESGRASFLNAIGMPNDISPEEFAAFEKDLLAPIPTVDRNKKDFSPEKLAKLAKGAKNLEVKRAEWEKVLPLMYRKGIPDVEKKGYAERLTTFLLLRYDYEQEVLGKSDKMEKWMMYAGVVGMELAEEGLEALVKIDGGAAGLKKMPFLRDLGADKRKAVFDAWQNISGNLTKRGVPMQKLGAVLSTMNKTPVGPQFWKKLLEVESPVTILLWGLHMHTSENKIKAALQFGSFIAMSNASNALLGFVERIGIVGRIPGHPAVKFAAALAVAFMTQEQVEAFTTWADESIPDGPEKHKAGVALGLMGAESLFSVVGSATEVSGLSGVLDKYGMSGFDPDRDMMNYLGEEGITIDGNYSADRRFLHSNLADWNDRLGQYLPSQDNKILHELQEGLRLDYKTWPKRRAVLLFVQYGNVVDSEVAVTKTLRERGVPSAGAKISASDVAVANGLVKLAKSKIVSLVMRISAGSFARNPYARRKTTWPRRKTTKVAPGISLRSMADWTAASKRAWSAGARRVSSGVKADGAAEGTSGGGGISADETGVEKIGKALGDAETIGAGASERLSEQPATSSAATRIFLTKRT